MVYGSYASTDRRCHKTYERDHSCYANSRASLGVSRCYPFWHWRYQIRMFVKNQLNIKMSNNFFNYHTNLSSWHLARILTDMLDELQEHVESIDMANGMCFGLVMNFILLKLVSYNAVYHSHVKYFIIWHALSRGSSQ